MYFESRFNIIYLGICFMVLFSAFTTLENLHKLLINSIKDELPGYEGDGYFSLMLLYGTCAVFMWLAPSIISILGPVKSMVISSIGYLIYIAVFYIESAWAINLGCIIEGCCSAVLWTAEGNYIVLNSNPSDVAKNTGIFWTIFQTSSLYGNIFVYFAFDNKTHIGRSTRHVVILVLFGVSVLSCLMMSCLRSPKKESAKENNDGPIAALKKSWLIFIDPKMIALSITFGYLGFEVIYIIGVYSSCLGFTLRFGKIAKQLVAISSILIGIGEITGGLLPVLLSKLVKPLSWGRSLLFSVGFICQLVSFGLMYINLPSNSIFGDTQDEAIIESSVVIGLLCSFLLGIGDGLFITQSIELLAYMFPGESSKSLALYSFSRSVFGAVGFIASNYFDLQSQVIVLCILGFLGTAIFCKIDFAVHTKNNNNNSKPQQPTKKGNKVSMVP